MTSTHCQIDGRLEKQSTKQTNKQTNVTGELEEDESKWDTFHQDLSKVSKQSKSFINVSIYLVFTTNWGHKIKIIYKQEIVGVNDATEPIKLDIS